MRIVCGDTYTITADAGFNITGSELSSVLKDARTYKVAAGAGSLSFDVKRVFGVHGSNGAALFESNAYQSDQAYLINVSAGHVFNFPDLPASGFTPARFSSDVTYHNNISELGEYLGSSIVRRGQTLSVQPLAFRCDASRAGDLDAMLDAIRGRAFFCEYKTPSGVETSYGWLSSEPKIQWTGVVDFMTVQIEMRCHAPNL